MAQEESIGGLMGMSKAQSVVHNAEAQPPMQPPVDHGESLAGLMGS